MLLYRELRASPFREVKSGYTVGTQRLSLGRFIIPWPFNHETSKSDLFLPRITKRLTRIATNLSRFVLDRIFFFSLFREKRSVRFGGNEENMN